MKSIDLTKCLQLFAGSGITLTGDDCVSHSTEISFLAATEGLPAKDVELLRELAALACIGRTMAALLKMSDDLGGPMGRKLSSVLRRIDHRHKEISHLDFDSNDFLRCVLTLLFSTPPREVDELVLALSAYGREAAQSRLKHVEGMLVGSSLGEALRYGWGLTEEPVAEVADRAGVSAAAISKSSKRVRRILHGKG